MLYCVSSSQINLLFGQKVFFSGDRQISAVDHWVPEVPMDNCVMSAGSVPVLILFLCWSTGPLLIYLLFTFDEDRTISTK